MVEDGDGASDDVALWIRDTIGAAGLEDAGTESRLLQLADAGRGEEALKLLEAVARPAGTDEMFWRLMAETAAALGIDERVAEYRRRLEEHAEYPAQWPFSAFDHIMSVVRSACPMTDGFSAIVDLCAGAWPHEDWPRFRALELEPDVARLKRWLESLLVADPPGPHAHVLWFGLCNPIREGEPTSDVAVRGLAADPQHPGPVTWAPRNPEAGSAVLAQIYALAYPDEQRTLGGDPLEPDEDEESLGNDAEYPLCLAYVGLAVRTLATAIAPELWLARATRRELLFGFDAGDAIALGTITHGGLRLRDR